MAVRERPPILPTRIKDAAVRIPRSAKDAAKNLNRYAENIRERRYDTSEQYAESQIEQAGQQLAQRGGAMLEDAARDGAKRGQDAIVRSLQKCARRRRMNRPTQQTGGSGYGNGQPPNSTSGPAISGPGVRSGSITTSGAPPSTAQSLHTSPANPPNGGFSHAPVFSGHSPQTVHHLHIRYRTGYVQRKLPQALQMPNPATQHAISGTASGKRASGRATASQGLAERTQADARGLVGQPADTRITARSFFRSGGENIGKGSQERDTDD